MSLVPLRTSQSHEAEEWWRSYSTHSHSVLTPLVPPKIASWPESSQENSIWHFGDLGLQLMGAGRREGCKVRGVIRV